MSSISDKNKTNASYYESPDSRVSLLVNPISLAVFKSYVKKKTGDVEDTDNQLAKELAANLEPIIREKEPVISSAIMETIRNKWIWAETVGSSVDGEADEKVAGYIDEEYCSGQPDGVVRLPALDGEEFQAQVIIEVSVDKNGGVKKAKQAFDYAQLMKDKSKTVLLFTFHIDRPDQDKGNSTLKITQEAFIYLHDDNEQKRKIAFLWREIYEQDAEQNDNDFLVKSCNGLVRCLECSVDNRDGATIYQDEPWELVSDNVAICNGNEDGKHVLKIFDNRFHPTYRRPDQWLNDQSAPWIEKLGGVETELEFRESQTINPDPLGKPANLGKRRHSRSSVSNSHTPYLRGSVKIIKYKYINGTHYASQVSHFRDIAQRISEMHQRGIVHGDIRGFNMLHPFPNGDSQQAEGIENSLLIDFDFSGSEDTDSYPPGYAQTVGDTPLPRSGSGGEVLKKENDWKDLGAVMAAYFVDSAQFKDLAQWPGALDSWESLWEKVHEKGEEAVGLIAVFVQTHGDLALQAKKEIRMKMEKHTMKGTGSPNKKQQGPRGSLSVHRSSN